MGLYDRDYTQHNYGERFRNTPRMRMGFGRMPPVVKWLLIINVAVFFLAIIIRPLGNLMYRWGQLDPSSPAALQLWRLITYQFLHDPSDPFHILFNMIGLFFLGPVLERHWGSKRFLKFYLGCGVAGALLYYLLVGITSMQPLPMVGASGAILGLLAACAIMFPHFVVILLFFPVPIRTATLLLTVVYLVNVLTAGVNAGGNAAHLGGMAAGALYVYSGSWRGKLKLRFRSTSWEKKAKAEQQLQQEVDRILKKVHNSGMHSLTPGEKKKLKKATRASQQQQRFSSPGDY